MSKYTAALGLVTAYFNRVIAYLVSSEKHEFGYSSRLSISRIFYVPYFLIVFRSIVNLLGRQTDLYFARVLECQLPVPYLSQK